MNSKAAVMSMAPIFNKWMLAQDAASIFAGKTKAWRRKKTRR
jgi:hypothetical protein